jgi:hypothetical protein
MRDMEVARIVAPNSRVAVLMTVILQYIVITQCRRMKMLDIVIGCCTEYCNAITGDTRGDILAHL